MFSSTTWGVREEMISLIETCKFVDDAMIIVQQEIVTEVDVD